MDLKSKEREREREREKRDRVHEQRLQIPPVISLSYSEVSN